MLLILLKNVRRLSSARMCLSDSINGSTSFLATNKLGRRRQKQTMVSATLFFFLLLPLLLLLLFELFLCLLLCSLFFKHISAFFILFPLCFFSSIPFSNIWNQCHLWPVSFLLLFVCLCIYAYTLPVHVHHCCLSVCTAYYKTSCVCQCLWYTMNSLYHIYSDIMFAVYIHCAYCSLLTTVCSSLTFNLSVSVSVLCVSVFVLISLSRYLFVPCVYKVMCLVQCTCQQKISAHPLKNHHNKVVFVALEVNFLLKRPFPMIWIKRCYFVFSTLCTPCCTALTC